MTEFEAASLALREVANDRAEVKAQHAESMEALKVLIERTGTNRESDIRRTYEQAGMAG